MIGGRGSRPARRATCCHRSPAAEQSHGTVAEGRGMIGLVGLALVVVGLVHLYLWKRLVRDTLRPGWRRRLGTVLAVLLAVLVPATLIGTRTGYAEWLAWPGYVWLAVMFYLLVTLVVMEVPRLVVRLAWRGLRPSGTHLPAAV